MAIHHANEEYSFPLIKVKDYEKQWENLAVHNELYDLTVIELVEKGIVGVRIYENDYVREPVELQETEQAILVTSSGQSVAEISPISKDRIKTLLESGRIHGMSLQMLGGPYKIVLKDDADNYSEERETASLYANLTLEVLPEVTPSGDDSVKNFMGGNAALEAEREERRNRGFVPLLLAVLVTAVYIAFAGLYWWSFKNGKAQLYPFLPQGLNDLNVYIHLGVMGGALLFCLFSMASRSKVLPFLTLLLFAGAVGYPYYLYRDYYVLIPSAFQALMCLIATIRK